jgi:ribulose 1,5-bisphosphate synthetase/thiazole synthase
MTFWGCFKTLITIKLLVLLTAVISFFIGLFMNTSCTDNNFFDVIIVGAGPSGTGAAYDLAVAGFKVKVLDKKEFPRFKPCAGGVTAKALNLFKFSIAPVIRSTTDTLVVGYGTTKQHVLK